MKKKSILTIITLILAFAGTQAIGYNVSEFPICTNDANQINPAISGSIVVWEDYRNGNWDIYGYDLSTQTEFPICTNDANQINPDISGDIVVWEDHRYDSTYRGFYYSIYGYKLSTRTEFLVYDMASYQRDPTIDGNFVVWKEYYTTPQGIYKSIINGYSLSGHTKFLILENELLSYKAFHNLAVSGSNIVLWINNYPYTDGIKTYDFYNHTFFPTIDGQQSNISGSIVVYQQYGYKYPSSIIPDYRICYTDFSKQCTGPLSRYIPIGTYYYSHCLTYNDPSPCQSDATCHYVEGDSPDISGNIIVWNNWIEHEDFYGTAIYGYDISTMTWFPIRESSESNRWHHNPAIDGNIVIWEDKRNGNYDIYGARLEPFCLGKPEMDFNGDCKVDFADFAIMASSWLECNLVPESACWE
ncbi:MAG: hypothetical protein NTX52_02355 [Planctomycetota bacterium]|nr:hypothetical protein [Planctomycetota bacterium]